MIELEKANASSSQQNHKEQKEEENEDIYGIAAKAREKKNWILDKNLKKRKEKKESS